MPHKDHLARWVTARRDELGLNQADVTTAGGPSTAVLSNIERGVQDSYKRNTFPKLDHALQWAQGSAARIWFEGGEPDPIINLDENDLDAEMQGALREIRELAQEMRGLMPLVAEALGHPRS